MTTFARIVDGFALDCQVAATATELASRFHPEWLAKNPFVQVPDDTIHGAKDNGNGSFTNPVPVVVIPQPNTSGNPYFGKKPRATKDFFALIGQVLTPSRYKRLKTDSAFLWIDDVLQHVTVVDPDDKAGQFLQIVAYLVGTTGDDGQVLMTKPERDAIMAAW